MNCTPFYICIATHNGKPIALEGQHHDMRDAADPAVNDESWQPFRVHRFNADGTYAADVTRHLRDYLDGAEYETDMIAGWLYASKPQADTCTDPDPVEVFERARRDAFAAMRGII